MRQRVSRDHEPLFAGRLTKPLKRVGERGQAEFKEIEWDEALELASTGSAISAKPTHANSPSLPAATKPGLTGWWASQFGTPNHAAHGGFCSVNMAAGGIYTIGGSFWEFGEPDWDLTKYMLMFGVAEDHDSNPIKAGLSKTQKERRQIRFAEPHPDGLFRDCR